MVEITFDIMIRLLAFFLFLPLLCYGEIVICHPSGSSLSSSSPDRIDCLTTLVDMLNTSAGQESWERKVTWGKLRGHYSDWGCGHTWSRERCSIRLTCSKNNFISFREIYGLANRAVDQCVLRNNPPQRSYAMISKDAEWGISIEAKAFEEHAPHIYRGVLSRKVSDFYRGI